MTDMNSPSCSASSVAYDNDEGQRTSSERPDECATSSDSSDEGNKEPAPTASVSIEERIRPIGRSYSLRRRLHHCIAAIQDRRANPTHYQRGFDLLPRRQRNPERDLLLDHRRELRRLWMYLDAIAVVRLSRVPPGG